MLGKNNWMGVGTDVIAESIVKLLKCVGMGVDRIVRVKSVIDSVDNHELSEVRGL